MELLADQRFCPQPSGLPAGCLEGRGEPVAGAYRRRIPSIVIVVGGTRVTLDTVIARYHQGDRAEAIHEGFNTVPLADIHAVIAYYLAHQRKVDAYLRQREEEAARIRAEIEANYTPEQKARTEYFRRLLAEKRAVL